MCYKPSFLFLITAIPVMLLNVESTAFDRKILAEIFTNTSCPLCPRYIPPAQDALEDELDDDEYIFMTYHTWWPDIEDPWYLENYERHLPEDDDVLTRMNWMERDQWMGVPSFFFDGHRIDYHEGDYVRNIVDYVSDRIEVDSPLQIGLEAYAHGDDLITRVTINSDERLSNLTLFLALCEKEVYYNARSGQRRFTGNMLDLFPDGSGQRFSIVPNYEVRFDNRASLDVGWRENEIEDLFVAAWVQRLDQEILQSQDRAEIMPIEAPAAFSLISPADGCVVDRNNCEVTFEWEESDCGDYATSYTLVFEVLGDENVTLRRGNIETSEFTEHLDSLFIQHEILGGEIEEDVEMTWYVEATNGVLTTESNERWSMLVPVPSSVPPGGGGPAASFNLGRAYPNPFNSRVTIPFSLARPGYVTMTMHDLSGREVARLTDGGLSAGGHAVSLDADRVQLAGGIYCVRLTSLGRELTQKIVCLR